MIATAVFDKLQVTDDVASDGSPWIKKAVNCCFWPFAVVGLMGDTLTSPHPLLDPQPARTIETERTSMIMTSDRG